MSDQMPPPSGNPVEPGPQQALPQQPRTPKIIVWAFILSLFGIFVLPVVAAVAMAIAGLGQAKKIGKGQGLAIAALVVSGFWVILLVAIIAIPSDDTSSRSSNSATVEIVEEQSSEISEAADQEATQEPQAETASFAECIQSPYRSEYLPTVVALLGESSDIASNAGSDGINSLRFATEQLQAQGRDYDAVGRQIKFADDCGDPKFGALNTELGDLLIQLGSEMTILDFDSMLASGDTSDLDAVTSTLGLLNNQVVVMTEYIQSLG